MISFFTLLEDHVGNSATISFFKSFKTQWFLWKGTGRGYPRPGSTAFAWRKIADTFKNKDAIDLKKKWDKSKSTSLQHLNFVKTGTSITNICFMVCVTYRIAYRIVLMVTTLSDAYCINYRLALVYILPSWTHRLQICENFDFFRNKNKSKCSAKN